MGFPNFSVTVDLVVLAFDRGQLSVVLVRRDQEPFVGEWALPGGFKRPDESLLAAASRELFEETGLREVEEIVQFGAFGDPGRDPRTNVVTIGHLVVTNPSALRSFRAGGDAREVALVPVDAVTQGTIRLAFDHAEILGAAIEALATRLEHTGIAPRLLDEPFTLPELRRVYEVLWGVQLNPSNFRRALIPTKQQVSDSGGAKPHSVTLGTVLTAPTNEGWRLLRRGVVQSAETATVPRTGALAGLVASESVRNAEALLRLSSLGERSDIPFVVPAEGQEDRQRMEWFRATIAWDVLPTPIRRPRRRAPSRPNAL